jgi:hypothetical protein
MADMPNPSGHAAAASTSLVASGPDPSFPPPFPNGSIQDIIATTLQIPAHLTDRTRGDLHVAYAKYLALLDTVTRLNIMVKDGLWKHKRPANDDIIEVFISKSAYFKNYDKIFPMVKQYPAMEKWLQIADDAPPDVDVWNYKKQTFDNLKKILNAHCAPRANTQRKNTHQDKGKGKMKVDGGNNKAGSSKSRRA